MVVERDCACRFSSSSSICFVDMALSTGFLSSIEKLDGRSNFSSWKFAVKAYLEHEGLWKSIEGNEQDPEKLIKAKSKLVLLIKPINFAHIQSCETAKDMWQKLKDTFEDSGLMRRVTLIRILTSTKLESCDNIEEYVNLIMNTAHKLAGIGCKIEDEWIGTFLLAGLPDVYQPMIMAIESSGIPIRADAIKTKLLQDIKTDTFVRSNSALYSGQRNSKFNRNDNRQGPRCYECNEYGHISINCCKKRENLVSSDPKKLSSDLRSANSGNGTSLGNGHFANSGNGHFANGGNGRFPTGYCAGFVSKCKTDSKRKFGSETSVSYRDGLVDESIGHATSDQHYDCVYVDDVLSVINEDVELNLNSGGDRSEDLNLNLVENFDFLRKYPALKDSGDESSDLESNVSEAGF